MTKGYVREATASDATLVALKMRPEDKSEVKAASGRGAYSSLMEAIDHPGANTRTVCLGDGTPCAMFGILPSGMPGIGLVWMLATTDFIKLKSQFVRETPKHIDDLAKGYDTIFNFTDARNLMHHKWIKYAGFTIIKEHQNFGVEKRPFLEFVKIVKGESYV